MQSSPLESTHGVVRRRAWFALTPLGLHAQLDDVARAMPSSPLDITDGRMTTAITCHHCPSAAHTVRLRLVWRPSSPLDITYDRGRRVWHAIITFGLHIQWDDVWRFMSLSHLGSTHGRITSGIACHLALGQHTWSDDVECGMPLSLLDNTKDRTSSGLACHHRPWAAHTVKRRLVWHTIIAIGKHTRS